MGSSVGWLRKRLLVTAPAEITFPVRGFETADAPARPVLETAALHFTVGFEFGIEYPTGAAAHLRLEALEWQFRGFAYEGAIMAMAVRDAISPAPGNRLTEQFLSGPAAPHAFLGCLGIGFALGRMPSPVWRRTLPDRGRIPGYPTTTWAVIDGYGFHQAFFRTRRWLDPGHVPRRFAWDGNADYVPRAIDQGMGRALWFVAGGNVGRLGALVDRFPAHRRGDLWSGAGLAATYAGGVGAEALEALCRRAAGHRGALAVGAVLAVRARTGAGIATEHTELAAQALCGMSTERAGDLAEDAMRDLPEGGPVPAYETFRQRIGAHFDSH